MSGESSSEIYTTTTDVFPVSPCPLILVSPVGVYMSGESSTEIHTYTPYTSNDSSVT